MTKEKNTEYLLGVALFSWESWDELDTDCLHFYNVQWKFPSMAQYDGGDVTLYRNGTFELHDQNGEPIALVGAGRSLLSIKEFKDAILNQIQKG